MQEEEIGALKISDDMLAICAAGAARRVRGVGRLGRRLAENLPDAILGLASAGKGVKVSRVDAGLRIDVYATVKYKVRIPQLAWEIQSTVKREIERISGEKVLAVDIHVQGVEPPQEESKIDKETSEGIHDAGILPDGSL